MPDTTASSDSSDPSSAAQLLENDPKIKSILASDSSLEILLNRLKQSLNTSEEFSKFLRKKAQIEDDHYNQLRKFAGNSRTGMKNSGSRLKNDSLSVQLDKIISFDEQVYNVGSSYVKGLNTMYDELTALVETVAKQRKAIKDDGKRREKECMDAISAAQKAKTKYDHLCEDLDRLKTMDPSKKSFSLKNKSVEQQEDDLTRKVDTADQDYKSKCTTCKKLKDEILVIHRPNSCKKLKNLILELDIALNVQLQKYATWSETLIMNSGVLISPLPQSNKPSMRKMANSIDNERDLYQYLLSSASSVSTNGTLIPVEYQVHPTLRRANDIGKPFLKSKANNFGNTSTFSSGVNKPTPAINTDYRNDKPEPIVPPKEISPVPPVSTTSSYYPSLDPKFTPANAGPTPDLNGPKPLIEPIATAPTHTSPPKPQLTPSQPTFGVSIEDVIQFAGVDNVPLVVRKCIEIIETYGLNIEGIYRTSSNSQQVQQLRDLINENFTNYLMIGKDINPKNVIHTEIFTVASLLKMYFSSLPEPLFTATAAPSFIECVKSNDATYIAKKLHHLVFNLPDGAYFTLRALIFHLNKVAQHEQSNRMNSKSLAIIWGPALFNQESESIDDLSYKSKVVEELMLIAEDIFELDD
ncbi:cortical Rho GTPase activating protein [Spathaspora passalidarum NRRL Y-27907]|uniref:Cortical Rho GTPase activating protein n=1 Tax=Spathaspora passalidarum (strain NRRL Y-27907 / 11-Y1) TaxID=619300 RepID=G3AGE4_SPAPN|nr:cortical Rho GTPase activating protein [Spathaspora passalidarum NRRL Y-27907]EGW35283.1 cortical Rho GTPase activating protein [Spathaspora passalidarum NRRL Y-27907]